MLRFSKITRKRWSVFRSHKRGYGSLIAMTSLVVISLFAEFLCNDKPLIIRYEGDYYFPILKSYPETIFGGFFTTETDYRDKDILKSITTAPNWVVFPPIGYGYDYIDTSLAVPAPSPPDHKHVLGTDDRGRDIAARLIYGFRLSVLFGLCLAITGSLIGIIIGALQGFFGGRVDLIGQRLIEIWSSLPELYLLIILSSIFSPSVGLILGLMTIFGWTGLSAYVRAEFLRGRNLDFVIAAQALGASRMRVMVKHILPNTLTPVITFFPFRVSGAITGLTALDYLGLGVPSPTPSLGELLAQGKGHLESWWIILSTFIVLVVTLTLLNFVGEGARKAMDPKVLAE